MNLKVDEAHIFLLGHFGGVTITWWNFSTYWAKSRGWAWIQTWPKDIRYSLSSDIRIKMVVIFILSFFYSEWSNNHLIFILSFHFLGIILFEKLRITSNNHSFFKMGKNVISWLLFPSNFGRESLVWQLLRAITDKCSH